MHVQPHCKTIWQFFPKLNKSHVGIQQSCFQHLGNCFENLCTKANEDAIMHNSTFIMAKNLKKSGYPSKDECISKLGYIHVKASRICHPKICLSGKRIIGLLGKKKRGASLAAQWLRVHLPMQETRVRALVQEDPTCRGKIKPVCHNDWACALEPASHNYWAHAPRARAPQQEKPPQWEACAPQWRVAPARRN